MTCHLSGFSEPQMRHRRIYDEYKEITNSQPHIPTLNHWYDTNNHPTPIAEVDSQQVNQRD